MSDILKFCRDQIEGLIEALKLTTDKMRGVIEPDMYDENYHRIHKGESLIGEIDRALQSFSAPPVPEPSASARECAHDLLCMLFGVNTDNWPTVAVEKERQLIDAIAAHTKRVVAEKDAATSKFWTDKYDSWAKKKKAQIKELEVQLADKQAHIAALEARVKSAREIIINLTANGVPSDAYMDYCVDARRWLEECDDAV